MSTEIALTPDKVDLIKRTIAKDATNDELALFLHICKRAGLDPLAKQIYFQKRVNRKTGETNLTIITGIDGYRATAAKTGQYAGSDDPVFDNEDRPTKATVTVWRIVGGQRCPFSASARWSQYYPGDSLGFMWNKMPHLMLGKCAEALALRKAFPNELSGMYTKEEMEQADGEEPKRASAQSAGSQSSIGDARASSHDDAGDRGYENKNSGKSDRNLTSELKGAAASKNVSSTAAPKSKAFNIQDPTALNYLSDLLDTAKPTIPKDKYNAIAERFDGKYKVELPKIIREITGVEPKWEIHHEGP